MRIVTTDHYLASPIAGLDVCYNEYRGTDISKVPVIRVYGITPAGETVLNDKSYQTKNLFYHINIPY